MLQGVCERLFFHIHEPIPGQEHQVAVMLHGNHTAAQEENVWMLEIRQVAHAAPTKISLKLLQGYNDMKQEQLY